MLTAWMPSLSAIASDACNCCVCCDVLVARAKTFDFSVMNPNFLNTSLMSGVRARCYSRCGRELSVNKAP